MERHKPEYFMKAAEMTDEILLESLEFDYRPEPIPSCRICGGTLSCVSIGDGPTIWACSDSEEDPNDTSKYIQKPGRTMADKHYSDSRWYQHRHGDSRVMELVKRFKILDKLYTELDDLTGERDDLTKWNPF